MLPWLSDLLQSPDSQTSRVKSEPKTVHFILIRERERDRERERERENDSYKDRLDVQQTFSLFLIHTQLVCICQPPEVKCGNVPELWTKELSTSSHAWPMDAPNCNSLFFFPLLWEGRKAFWGLKVRAMRCKVQGSLDLCLDESCPGELLL